MQHRRLDKGQRRIAELQRIAGLDIHIIPVLMIMSAKDGLALLRAINRTIRDLAHQCRQRAAVIGLIVLHDDCINFL